MTPEEKSVYIDTFLKGLVEECSFPSSLANVLELSQIPRESNKLKFKMLEFELEKLGLVQLVRGRDNSTLGGQCEYFISDKGLEYVMSNKSTLELFKKHEKISMEKINWTKAYNRLFKIIDGSARMTGSEFLNVAREVDDSIPSYQNYIDGRRAENKSTTRRDFYWDVIDEMTEEQKHEFFQVIISDLEKKVPDQLDDLKDVFGKGEAVIRKKAVPSKDMPEEIYIDILATLYNTYRSAEQKPSLYKGKGEEDLRDFGLMMLESRYESVIAVGEAFNKEGKTDIILKSDNGSNLFVAECKVWHGAVQFHDAIDQLFGYLTWRDTKSTLIFFVRNADFTSVLAKIKEEAQKHPLYLKYVGDRAETSSSFIFKHKEDPERIIKIEIMAFHLP